MRLMKSRPVHKGFTLIELLVVISIIALLISLLLPSLGQAKLQASKTKAAGQLHGIGAMLHTYVADNNGVYPIEPGVNYIDGYLPTGGCTISGGLIRANGLAGMTYVSPTPPDQIYGPMGLGMLAYPGVYAEKGNTDPRVKFGGYMPPEMLFAPERLITLRKHANNNWNGQKVDPVGYFGYKKAVFDGTTLPLNPGGISWNNTTYANYYLNSSYAYRGGHRGQWSGKTGRVESDHNLQWTVDGVATLNGGYDWSYLRESSTKNAPGISLVAELPQWEHNAKLGGGNYLLSDGSVHWFPNVDYGNGRYTSNSAVANPATSTNPLANTCSGIATDMHHGIHQNLIFAAIDRYRSGRKVPGSDGVSGFTYTGN